MQGKTTWLVSGVRKPNPFRTLSALSALFLFSTKPSARKRGDFPHTFGGMKTQDLTRTAQNTGISLMEGLSMPLIARRASSPNRSK
jgi:hypothetical protein